MKTVACLVIASLICLSPMLSRSASAVTLPVTFETPTYTTGNVVGQDGWTSPLEILLPGIVASDQANVVNTGVISGGQSLRLTDGDAPIQQVASGSLGAPTYLTWLVRVDNSDGGDFEGGLLAPDLTTPIDIIFDDSGALKYYLAGGQNFTGNPTYSHGTVYQVKLLNIDYTADTYDVNIIDTSTNSTIASALSLPFASSTDGPVSFLATFRGTGPGSSGTIDNISVPEPTAAALCGVIAMATLVRRRRA